MTVPRLPGAPAQRVAHVTPAPRCSERTPEVVCAGGDAQAGARLEHGAVHAGSKCGRSGGRRVQRGWSGLRVPTLVSFSTLQSQCRPQASFTSRLSLSGRAITQPACAWDRGADHAACRPTKTPRMSEGCSPMIPSPPPPCRRPTRWTRRCRSRSRSLGKLSSSGSKFWHSGYFDMHSAILEFNQLGKMRPWRL